MNWLLIVVIGIIGFHAIDGYIRGFIKKAVSVLSLIITLVVVTWVTPFVSGFVQSTPIYDSVQEKCIEMFVDAEVDAGVKTEQVRAIEEMNLPESVKNILLENNNHEVYEVLNVDGFREYIGAYLTRLIINAVTFVISFIIVWTALRIVIAALDLIAKLPVLKELNRLAGLGLGALTGVLIVWVGFVAVTIFCNGEFGQMLLTMIAENPFLSLLYNTNLILRLVTGLILG